MRAIAVKEFRELRRDRRTLAMLFLLPFLFLVVFGYAASFDIKDVPTVVVGAAAQPRRRGPPRHVRRRRHRRRTGTRPPPGSSCAAARRSSPSSRRPPATARRRSSSTAPSSSPPRRRSAASPSCGANAAGSGGQSPLAGAAAPAVQVDVLYNPDLRTAVIMIPGLCGIILVFVGTVATALGVVRERQSGTMEQLAVMPFRPRDVFLGKIAPVPAHRRGRHGRSWSSPACCCSTSPSAAPWRRSRSARCCSCSSPWGPACSSRASRRPRGRRSSWR